MNPSIPGARNDLVVKALGLLKHADSVELKLTVQDTDHRSAINALQLDILDAELRQVIFFDTADLKLDRHGVVVRARRTRSGGDTVVKLRPIVPTELAKELRQSPGFSVEVDAIPGTVMCSGSLKARTDNSAVNLVMRSQMPVRKLFSKAQRLLFKQHAPNGLSLDSLMALGPVNVAKLKFSPREMGRPMVAEMWFYPDSSRILELSTKCSPDEAFHALAELRAFLTERGIRLTGQQQTKTRKALEYFSRSVKKTSGTEAPEGRLS